MKSERYEIIEEFEEKFGGDRAMNLVGQIENIKAIFGFYDPTFYGKENFSKKSKELEVKYNLIAGIGTECRRYLEAIEDLESASNLKNTLKEIRRDYVKIQSVLRSSW